MRCEGIAGKTVDLEMMSYLLVSVSAGRVILDLPLKYPMDLFPYLTNEGSYLTLSMLYKLNAIMQMKGL
jgi:hypothetical protein